MSDPGPPELYQPPPDAGAAPAPAAGAPQPYAWAPPAPPTGYAPWLRRVGGYLLDELLLVPFFVVGGAAEAAGGGSGAAVAAVVYLGSFVFGIWNQVFRQGRTGQSLGKQWVGIRLVRERDGEPIGPGLTFVRALAHILDALPFYLGFFWPLWDPKRQTFADKVCHTVVLTV